jgi:integral membrane protein
MSDAITRWRIMAYVGGVALLLLCVGMVLKYAFDSPEMVRIVGQIHGFLFAVYALATINLGRSRGWALRRTVLTALAGTVPAMSFVMDRRLAHERALTPA